MSVMVDRARALIAASFKKIGNRETAIKIGKHDSQVTGWRSGKPMTKATALGIIRDLGHRRVK